MVQLFVRTIIRTIAGPPVQADSWTPPRFINQNGGAAIGIFN